MSAIASRIEGMDMIPSMTRMTTASTTRKKPHRRPITRPMKLANAATAKPTTSETRAP